MLDVVLDWFAVLLPLALSIIGVFVSIKAPQSKHHRAWRLGLVACGVVVSVLTGWQQFRSRDAHAREIGALTSRLDELSKNVMGSGYPVLLPVPNAVNQLPGVPAVMLNRGKYNLYDVRFFIFPQITSADNANTVAAKIRQKKTVTVGTLSPEHATPINYNFPASTKTTAYQVTIVTRNGEVSEMLSIIPRSGPPNPMGVRCDITYELYGQDGKLLESSPKR